VAEIEREPRAGVVDRGAQLHCMGGLRLVLLVRRRSRSPDALKARGAWPLCTGRRSE
jgi:hypothetical protein